MASNVYNVFLYTTTSHDPISIYELCLSLSREDIKYQHLDYKFENDWLVNYAALKSWFANDENFSSVSTFEPILIYSTLEQDPEQRIIRELKHYIIGINNINNIFPSLYKGF